MKHSELDRCYREIDTEPLSPCKIAGCPEAAMLGSTLCRNHTPTSIVEFDEAVWAYRRSRLPFHSDCRRPDEPSREPDADPGSRAPRCKTGKA